MFPERPASRRSPASLWLANHDGAITRTNRPAAERVSGSAHPQPRRVEALVRAYYEAEGDEVAARYGYFENVCVLYGVGPEVLRDLTFSIEPNSFQFLTGPSGAGKTTLLRLLFLSLRPTRGLISVFNYDTSTLGKDSLATLRRRIGIVFQDFRLLDHMTT